MSPGPPEVGDLVNVSRVDESPWQVAAYDIPLSEVYDVLDSMDVPEWTVSEIGVGSESYAVVYKPFGDREALAVETSRVKVPADSAWFITP